MFGVRAVLGFLLAVTASTQLPAQADDQVGSPVALTAPVVTSPSPDDLITGDVTLTATSDAPYVVFELVSGSQSVHRQAVAADDDGFFRDVLPTIALGSRVDVRARACSSANLASCTIVGESVRIRRSSARSRSIGSWPSAADPAVLGHVSLQATDLGGHPATGTGLLAVNKQVREGDVVDVDLSTLPDGDYGLGLRQCNPLDGSICVETARTLRVRRAPHAWLIPGDLFLSQNGDGFWETASATVFLDSGIAVDARWRLMSDRRTVAGPFQLSAEEVLQAKEHGVDVVIDPRATLGHALPAGEYRFELEATALEPDFTKTKVVSVALHVSNTAPITKLTLNADVFYPNDTTADVSHVIQVATPFDFGEARYGGLGYRVLTSDGRTVGGPGAWWAVDPTSRRITWDGYYYEEGEPTRSSTGSGRGRTSC